MSTVSWRDETGKIHTWPERTYDPSLYGSCIVCGALPGHPSYSASDDAHAHNDHPRSVYREDGKPRMGEDAAKQMALCDAEPPDASAIPVERRISDAVTQWIDPTEETRRGT